jgi:hypothetical protein
MIYDFKEALERTSTSFGDSPMDMKQMNLVATACLGGIAVAFTFLLDFYPLWATLAFLGVLGYMAFRTPSKPKQPAEPWYMK